MRRGTKKNSSSDSFKSERPSTRKLQTPQAQRVFCGQLHFANIFWKRFAAWRRQKKF